MSSTEFTQFKRKLYTEQIIPLLNEYWQKIFDQRNSTLTNNTVPLAFNDIFRLFQIIDTKEKKTIYPLISVLSDSLIMWDVVCNFYSLFLNDRYPTVASVFEEIVKNYTFRTEKNLHIEPLSPHIWEHLVTGMKKERENWNLFEEKPSAFLIALIAFYQKMDGKQESSEELDERLTRIALAEPCKSIIEEEFEKFHLKKESKE